MKRTEKEQIVAEVAEIAGRAHGMFFTDFSGLTVEQATELPSRVPEIRRRLQGREEHPDPEGAREASAVTTRSSTGLVGPTGVAFAYRRSGCTCEDHSEVQRRSTRSSR